MVAGSRMRKSLSRKQRTRMGGVFVVRKHMHRMVTGMEEVLMLCAYRLSGLPDQAKNGLLQTHHMTLERQDGGWRTARLHEESFIRTEVLAGDAALNATSSFQLFLALLLNKVRYADASVSSRSEASPAPYQTVPRIGLSLCSHE